MPKNVPGFPVEKENFKDSNKNKSIYGKEKIHNPAPPFKEASL